MSSSGLFFPAPAGRGRDDSVTAVAGVPADDSSTHGGTSRLPPPNFASMRAAARTLRASKGKSPFVPKSVQRLGQRPPVERMTLDELLLLQQRNEELLSSQESGPLGEGAKDRIRETQKRVKDRISSLEQQRQSEDVRTRLEKTHITPPRLISSAQGQDAEPPELSALSISASPKNRSFFHQNHADSQTSPRGLTSAISMAESLELQRQAAERALEAKASAELEAQQKAAMKQSIRDSKEKNERMMNFLFAGESDSESDDGNYSDLELHHEHEGEINPSFLAEEESHELNPYKTAYTLGWNLAKHEEAQQVREDEDGDIA